MMIWQVYAKPQSNRALRETSLLETGTATRLKMLHKYVAYFSHLIYSLKVSALYLEAEQNGPDSTVIFH